MTVAVMGGAGFIGSNVCRALASRHVEVLSVDKVVAPTVPTITSLRMEISDSREIEEFFLSYGVTAVVHMIGMPSVGDCEKEPDLSFQLNTLSTQRIVEAMRRAEVTQLVFASTASVYGYAMKDAVSESAPPRPDTMYGTHKLISEQIVRAYEQRYGIKAAILRLFNVYGNSQYGKDIISVFLKAIIEKKPLNITGPQKYRDFVHVQDVANAFASVVERGTYGVTLNIGSGEKTRLKALGRIFKSESPSATIVEKTAPDDGTGLYADISHAKSLLGFSPRPTVDGIRDYVKQAIAIQSSRR